MHPHGIPGVVQAYKRWHFTRKIRKHQLEAELAFLREQNPLAAWFRKYESLLFWLLAGCFAMAIVFFLGKEFTGL